MTKPKTISLKGAAAAAFMRQASGQEETEDQKLESVAIDVHIAMKENDMPRAVKLLKAVRGTTVAATPNEGATAHG